MEKPAVPQSTHFIGLWLRNLKFAAQGIAGFAVGAAAKGMRPVAEIQFADYVYPAIDQVVNEMAKFRFRSGGVFDCGGVTLRMPYGA